MTLNELIKRLEEIREEHGGDLPLYGEYTESDGQYSLGWMSAESFVKVQDVESASKKRVVIG